MGERVYLWRGWRPKKNSLEAELVMWALVLALAPLLVTAYVSISHAKKSLINAAEERLVGETASQAVFFYNWFYYRIKDIEREATDSDTVAFLTTLTYGLSRSSEAPEDYVGSDDWGRRVQRYRQGLVSLMTRYDHIVDILLISDQGDILYSAIGDKVAGQNIRNSVKKPLADAVRDSLATRQTSFSDFVDTENTIPVSGYFVAPVLDLNQRVIGAIALRAKLSRVSESIRSNSSSQIISLLNRSGVAYESATPEHPAQLHVHEPSALSAAWLNDKARAQDLSKAVKFVNRHGIAHYGVAQELRILNKRWLLLNEVSQQQLLAPSYRLARSMIIVFCISALLVVAATALLARRLTSPLKILLKASSRAAAGSLDGDVVVHEKNEIGELAEQFNRMLAARRQYEHTLLEAKTAAEQASLAKSEFLACMSHEIRTPMNGVLGMLDLLGRTKLLEDQQRKLSIARSSALSLLNLINDILDFSKVEAGKLTLENIDFSLSDQVSESVRSFALAADSKGLELIVDLIGIDADHCMGDPSRLRQILTNLIGNAVKFTDHGEIVVHAKSTQVEDKIRFECSVIDSGIGISEEAQSRLFESFTQVDASASRRHGGTGLGLAICKKLCELMGGDIELHSEKGRGSRFCFFVLFDLSAAALTDTRREYYSLVGRRFLIIDDNTTNREIFNQQLLFWNAEVDENDSAASALARLSERGPNYYDALLVDFHMPEANGLDFVKKLRERSEFLDQKAVLLSSVSEVDNSENLLELGFAGYLIKPVLPGDLYDVLTMVLNTEHQAKPALLTKAYLNALPKSTTASDVARATGDADKILIVEDNAINQEVLSDLLHDMGLMCDIAANGEEALLRLNTANVLYSLIFMDCQMPVMDGYECTRKIRSGAAGLAARAIPICAMTANAMQGDRDKCLTAGMDDYLSKPVDLADLTALVKKWLGEEKISANVDGSEPQLFGEGDAAIRLPSHLATINFSVKRPDAARKARSYLKFLQTFIQHNETFCERLSRIYEQRDWVLFRQLVHSIKGSGGNLGMLPLFELASTIEKRLQDGQALDFAQLQSLLDTVTLALQDAQAIIAVNSSESGDDLVSVLPEKQVLADLCAQLASGKVLPAERVAEVARYSEALIPLVERDQLVYALNHFDYDEALSILDSAGLV